ncbi:hypothetical protein H1R20_g8909, partial [Candolleomyces eurysporus]
MPALPPSPTSTSAQASSIPTQSAGMDSAQSTTWRDTFGIALASCVPSSSSSCFPCLRRVPSDDSLLDHHNPSTAAPTPQSQPQRSRPPSNSNPFPNVSHGIPRARPDELQGLLSDSTSDSDVERVSLHSNFGRNRHRRKKKRNGGGNKKITLFGFDLFNVTGSRKAKPAPITLGDEDDAIYGTIGEGGASNSATPTPTSTGSAIVPQRKKNISITTANTFDSDAAPLNTALIEELVAKDGAARELVDVGRGSEEGLRHDLAEDDDDPHSQALFDTSSTKKSKSKRSRSHTSDKTSKETRDRLERERLHLERLKQQGVLPEDGDGEEFEGFQGSGSNVPGVASLADVLKGRVGSAGSRSRSSSSTTSSGGMGDAGVGEEQISRKSGKGGRSRAAPSTSGAPTASQDPAPSRANEPYGAFVQALTTLVSSTVGGAVAASSKEEGEDDDVDLDGSVYAGPTRRPYPHGGLNGGSGSQSRSRNGSTSTGTGAGQRDLRIPGSSSGSGHGRNASVGGSSHSSARLGHHGHRRQGSGLSNELGPGLQHQHYSLPPSPLSPHPPPTSASDPLSGPDPLARAKKTKKSKSSSSRSKSTTGSRTAKSHSSNASTSQSTSLASPVSSNFGPDSQAFVVSPSTVEQGLGFFDAEDFAPPTPPPATSPFGSEFPKAQRGGGGGFPSTGFGMTSSGASRFGARRDRDAVAFLSKRGEDDGFGGADGL